MSAETEYHTGRLNHERFKEGEGELARAIWEYETGRKVDFAYWLYSLYEPKEDAPIDHDLLPRIQVKVLGPGVFQYF